jgi:uncharacterized membrane protein
MIETVWPYAAVMLLSAGLFPSLENRYRWRFFSVLPPIVLSYLFVMALAVAGVWSPTPEIQGAQRAVTALILPALLFLLMVSCDLRAILAVGPRVLAVFACAFASILLSIAAVYMLFRTLLPEEGWKMAAALSATWTGGSANLVAVKQTIGLSESLLPPVLLADALVYSVWVLALFSIGAAAPKLNRWTRAAVSSYPQLAAMRTDEPATVGGGLLWLGLALAVSLGAGFLARELPVSQFVTMTTWTVVIATLSGLVLAHTPLARLSGHAPLASALLAVLIAVLASQSNFAGLASAPLFVLCGFIALVLHVALLALAARAFRFDVQLCGVASLAQIGGVASAPLLAATYSPVLVPIAVLLALLGFILGTGAGLFMANILSGLAPGAA